MMITFYYLEHTDNFYVFVICKVSPEGTMNHLSIVFMLFLAVSTIPAYAQNIHIDEKEEQILIEILECEEKIGSNEELTAAEKTVNQRKCSTEIRGKYVDVALSAKEQNDIKIKLQDLQRCDDWHSSYKFLDEATFRMQKNSQMATSCIVLYNDDLWKYNSEDRQQVLSDRLDQIKSETPIKNNVSDEFFKGAQVELERIYTLEKRIAELEDKLDNKDLIIREQMNVIVNLANTLKNTLFDGIKSLYSFA